MMKFITFAIIAVLLLSVAAASSAVPVSAEDNKKVRTVGGVRGYYDSRYLNSGSNGPTPGPTPTPTYIDEDDDDSGASSSSSPKCTKTFCLYECVKRCPEDCLDACEAAVDACDGDGTKKYYGHEEICVPDDAGLCFAMTKVARNCCPDDDDDDNDDDDDSGPGGCYDDDDDSGR